MSLSAVCGALGDRSSLRTSRSTMTHGGSRARDTGHSDDRTAMTLAPDEPASDHKHEVAPLELLFDLVFVFAVSQLSQHLLTHLSWRGAAETLVLMLGVFAVWLYTSWAATVMTTDRARTRW